MPEGLARQIGYNYSQTEGHERGKRQHTATEAAVDRYTDYSLTKGHKKRGEQQHTHTGAAVDRYSDYGQTE